MDVGPVVYKMEEFVKELQSKAVDSVVGHMGHKHTDLHTEYNELLLCLHNVGMSHQRNYVGNPYSHTIK